MADLPPDEFIPSEFAPGSLNFRITAYNEELVLREIIQQSHLPLVYCMIEDLPIGYCFSCHDTKTGDRVDIETVERATKNGTGHRYQFVHFYNPLKDGIAPRKSESWYRIKGALIKLTMNINWSDECDCDCSQNMASLGGQITMLKALMDRALSLVIERVSPK